MIATFHRVGETKAANPADVSLGNFFSSSTQSLFCPLVTDCIPTSDENEKNPESFVAIWLILYVANAVDYFNTNKSIWLLKLQQMTQQLDADTHFPLCILKC